MSRHAARIVNRLHSNYNDYHANSVKVECALEIPTSLLAFGSDEMIMLNELSVTLNNLS